MTVSTHYTLGQAGPEWMNEAIKHSAERARALHNLPIEYYNAPRLGPLEPSFKEAEDIAKYGRQAFLMSLKEAQDLARQSALPTKEAYKPYLNQYQDEVIKKMREEAQKNFNEITMPELAHRFGIQGRHNSARHGNLVLRASQDLNRDLMNKIANLTNEGYLQSHHLASQDLNRKMNAAKQMESLGFMSQAGNQGDIQALLGFGHHRKNQAQRNLDIAYEDWKRRQNEPWNRLHQYGAVISQQPISQNVLDYRHEAAAPEVNTLGNLGSLAGQLWAARMMGGR